MSQNFTTEMLNDDGIRSALELLQEQVSRYESDSKRKSFITGESNTSHLTPVYYIRQFKVLARKLKTRQYNLQLASLILMLHLPETTQQLLVKNAEMQFRLLRDSTPETLNVGQLEKLIKEVEAIAGTVGAA
ncbi:TPA: hypothetical protein ACNP9N_005263 [Enterobacter asburiae]|uniref:hypothetical protein n=1 Tax=Citrobacter sp. B72 TaxID=2807631 RepID=UPI0019597BDF|nr:hypothetical protein [Citrobacter sp. B72]QRQ77080.1 hypothetical protein JQN59_26840 [Citrobacter sp. B72]